MEDAWALARAELDSCAGDQRSSPGLRAPPISIRRSFSRRTDRTGVHIIVVQD